MMDWIDCETALGRLGVKAQTLYAYVSRGRIRMQADPADKRRSLYNGNDIASIAVSKARGRKPASIAASSMDWGEPAIPTRISTIYRSKLLYRGQDAISFARNATLEDTARLLWNVPDKPVFAPDEAPADGGVFALLAALASQGQSIIGRSAPNLAQAAAKIIGSIASVCGAVNGDGPIHERLAEGWDCDVRTADRLRQALAAMADHDLNASTFAARVAASTGASLPACLLSGLCTLTGPRHGGAGEALQHLLRDAHLQGAGTAVRQWLERDRMLPGFGHALYPGGDPRAALMLEGINPHDDLKALAASVFELTGLHPNCDYALAAMVKAFALPDHAPFEIFLIGRAVGWCAHIIEHNQEGTLIRPRGRFLGTLPD